MRMIPMLRATAITIIVIEGKLTMRLINTLMVAMGIAATTREAMIDWFYQFFGPCKSMIEDDSESLWVEFDLSLSPHCTSFLNIKIMDLILNCAPLKFIIWSRLSIFCFVFS